MSQLTEDGLNIEQSLSLQRFKNYIKKKSFPKKYKQVFKDNPGCWEMAKDFLTSQGCYEPLSFDIWYAHWYKKWYRIVDNPDQLRKAHYAVKSFVLEGFYIEKNQEKNKTEKDKS